jgi:hypothetical protein
MPFLVYAHYISCYHDRVEETRITKSLTVSNQVSLVVLSIYLK